MVQWVGVIISQQQKQKKKEKEKNLQGAEAPSFQERGARRGGFLGSPAPINDRARARGSAFGRHHSGEAPAAAPLHTRATHKKEREEGARL